MVCVPFIATIRSPLSDEAVMILLVAQSFSGLLQFHYSTYVSYKQNTDLWKLVLELDVLFKGGKKGLVKKNRSP